MRTTSAFQPKTETLLNSLVSYWKFDESSGNASDLIGGNTLTNTNTVGYASALINNGADFGTANTNKKLSSTTGYQTGSFTFSGWFKLKTEITTGQYGIFQMSDNTTALRNIILTYNYNAGSQTIVADYHKNNVSDNNITYASGAIGTSAWKHYVITYNGTTFTLYINGSSVGTPLTISGGGSGSSGTQGITFGLADRYAGSYASVLIDEVGTWSRALTTDEISRLYANGNGRTIDIVPNTTKLYFPLNGNSTDYSGNGNNGTETAITYPKGMFGQGARFNGTSSKIQQTTTAGTFGGSTITVSFWVNYMSTTPADLTFLIAKYNDGSDFGSWVCWYRTSGTKIQFGTNSDKTSNTMTLIDYIPKINSKWQHYTLVNNGSNALIYVDGLLVASGSREDMDSTSQPLTIGASNSGRYFTGMIDEVIIESRAWTAKEIETYYRKSIQNYKQKSLGANFVAYILALATGTFTYTGFATLLSSARKITATLGTFTLTGYNALFTIGKGISASLGQFTYTGVNVTLTSTRTMATAVGSFVLTGFDALLNRTKILLASTGTFVLTGIDTTVKSTRTMTAALGTFTYTGVATILKLAHYLVATAGSFILTGYNALLSSPYLWTKTNKNSSTWTEPNKNSSTWVDKPKS